MATRDRNIVVSGSFALYPKVRESHTLVPSFPSRCRRDSRSWGRPSFDLLFMASQHYSHQRVLAERDINPSGFSRDLPLSPEKVETFT